MPHLQAERSGPSAGAGAKTRGNTGTVTSAALALKEDRHSFELSVVAEPALEAPAAAALRTRLALALIVLVQVAWLGALGYAVLAFA